MLIVFFIFTFLRLCLRSCFQVKFYLVKQILFWINNIISFSSKRGSIRVYFYPRTSPYLIQRFAISEYNEHPSILKQNRKWLAIFEKYSISHFNEKDYSCQRRGRDKSVKTHTFVRRNPREFCIFLHHFFLFLCFYLFIYLLFVSRESQSVFVSCDGGGRSGKTRIVFPQLYFYIALLPVRVITSIACPFSIRVHYRITGSLCEIYPLFPPLVHETVFFWRVSPLFPSLFFSSRTV